MLDGPVEQIIDSTPMLRRPIGCCAS